MSKHRDDSSALSKFSKRASFGFVLALFASLFIPVSVAQGAVPLPVAPVSLFTCPGGGFYEVDALGVASRGGQSQYLDPSGTVVAGGNCAGDVVLDSSVRRIEDFAFESAPLTGVSIPNLVTAIGGGAFGFTGITALDVPDSVTTIGPASFQGAFITSLHLGAGVTTIGGNSFSDAALTVLELPNTVTSIGSSAFRSSILTTLVIPSSVTSIGSSAFRSSPLTSLTINSPSLSLGSAAFNATAVSNLTCFYNLGDAVISSTTLQSAVLPPACPVATPAPVVPAPAPAPAPATPVITSTPDPTPSASPTPTPVASPTASPTPMLPAPVAVSFSFRVAGFDPGSATLNSATKQSLARQAGKLNSAKRIVITGFSEGPRVLKSDYALSLKRAKTVRAHLQGMLGAGVRITVANKQSTQVGSQYRAVQISVVR